MVIIFRQCSWSISVRKGQRSMRKCVCVCGGGGGVEGQLHHQRKIRRMQNLHYEVKS